MVRGADLIDKARSCFLGALGCRRAFHYSANRFLYFSLQNQEIEKDIKRQDKEEEKVQKLLLLGEAFFQKPTFLDTSLVSYEA